MKRIVKLLGIFLVWNFSFSPSFGDDLVTILSLALENDPTLRQAKAILCEYFYKSLSKEHNKNFRVINRKITVT